MGRGVWPNEDESGQGVGGRILLYFAGVRYGVTPLSRVGLRKHAQRDIVIGFLSFYRSSGRYCAKAIARIVKRLE